MNISVLYEDPNILVINKPAGLIVHSATTPPSGVRPAHSDVLRDGRTNEPSVVDWLLHMHPEIKGVGENQETDRSGLVHRLDRETSGVMAIAKNQKAFAFLKEQFQSRKVEKIYHAFVYGRVKQDEGVIDRPIARSKRGGATWSATRGKKGKEREAVTEYKVLARTNPHQADLGGLKRSDGYSLIELRPLTGRTHQLRVHLKAINYPVVCDKLYAPSRGCLPDGKAGALGFNRLALHAHSLSLALQNGTSLKTEAPYPEDFEKALKTLNLES